MIQQLIQQEAKKRYGDYINYPLVFKEGAEFALKNQWVRASEMEDIKEDETYFAKFLDSKGTGYFSQHIFYWNNELGFISEEHYDKLFILDENI